MGKAYTFWGHRDCPSEVKLKLWKVLIDLIKSEDVEVFYGGEQGRLTLWCGQRCDIWPRSTRIFAMLWRWSESPAIRGCRGEMSIINLGDEKAKPMSPQLGEGADCGTEEPIANGIAADASQPLE